MAFICRFAADKPGIRVFTAFRPYGLLIADIKCRNRIAIVNCLIHRPNQNRAVRDIRLGRILRTIIDITAFFQLGHEPDCNRNIFVGSHILSVVSGIICRHMNQALLISVCEKMLVNGKQAVCLDTRQIDLGIVDLCRSIVHPRFNDNPGDFQRVLVHSQGSTLCSESVIIRFQAADDGGDGIVIREGEDNLCGLIRFQAAQIIGNLATDHIFKHIPVFQAGILIAAGGDFVCTINRAERSQPCGDGDGGGLHGQSSVDFLEGVVFVLRRNIDKNGIAVLLHAIVIAVTGVIVAGEDLGCGQNLFVFAVDKARHRCRIVRLRVTIGNLLIHHGDCQHHFRNRAGNREEFRVKTIVGVVDGKPCQGHHVGIRHFGAVEPLRPGLQNNAVAIHNAGCRVSFHAAEGHHGIVRLGRSGSVIGLCDVRAIRGCHRDRPLADGQHTGLGGENVVSSRQTVHIGMNAVFPCRCLPGIGRRGFLALLNGIGDIVQPIHHGFVLCFRKAGQAYAELSVLAVNRLGIFHLNHNGCGGNGGGGRKLFGGQLVIPGISSCQRICIQRHGDSLSSTHIGACKAGVDGIRAQGQGISRDGVCKLNARQTDGGSSCAVVDLAAGLHTGNRYGSLSNGQNRRAVGDIVVIRHGNAVFVQNQGVGGGDGMRSCRYGTIGSLCVGKPVLLQQGIVLRGHKLGEGMRLTVILHGVRHRLDGDGQLVNGILYGTIAQEEVVDLGSAALVHQLQRGGGRVCPSGGLLTRGHNTQLARVSLRQLGFQNCRGLLAFCRIAKLGVFPFQLQPQPVNVGGQGNRVAIREGVVGIFRATFTVHQHQIAQIQPAGGQDMAVVILRIRVNHIPCVGILAHQTLNGIDSRCLEQVVLIGAFLRNLAADKLGSVVGAVIDPGSRRNGQRFRGDGDSAGACGVHIVVGERPDVVMNRVGSRVFLRHRRQHLLREVGFCHRCFGIVNLVAAILHVRQIQHDGVLLSIIHPLIVDATHSHGGCRHGNRHRAGCIHSLQLIILTGNGHHALQGIFAHIPALGNLVGGGLSIRFHGNWCSVHNPIPLIGLHIVGRIRILRELSVHGNGVLSGGGIAVLQGGRGHHRDVRHRHGLCLNGRGVAVISGDYQLEGLVRKGGNAFQRVALVPANKIVAHRQCRRSRYHLAVIVVISPAGQNHAIRQVPAGNQPRRKGQRQAALQGVEILHGHAGSIFIGGIRTLQLFDFALRGEEYGISEVVPQCVHAALGRIYLRLLPYFRREYHGG